MKITVVIDFLPDSAEKYTDVDAIVAVDVIRATTTALTALATGRRVYPVANLEQMAIRAARLFQPILVGELGGNMPFGFDENNSPPAIERRSDIHRPMILISTSGTPLLEKARHAGAVYAACLRNYKAMAEWLIAHHRNIAVIGAGSRGEFRREDQLCCAWIAEMLTNAGFKPANGRTAEIIERWHDAPISLISEGHSADYLRRSHQIHDLEYILSHVNDLNLIAKLEGEELVALQ
jgi:2-phosphosulfolactate phosphatase